MMLRPVSSIRVYQQVSQMQLEHINVNIFGLSALFLRIISVGYVVSSGLPESWTFIQRLYIQLYS